MNTYTIIAGVNGTGKSSFRGVLEGQRLQLGHIIDPDLMAKNNGGNLLISAKAAVKTINECLDKNISFTQETTLSGQSVINTVKRARKQNYNINLFYLGLSSVEESIARIANRVKKGGHNIHESDVIRRFNRRFDTLIKLVPYCDEISFYDNENGFIKVAEIINCQFHYTNDYNPDWIKELYSLMKLKQVI